MAWVECPICYAKFKKSGCKKYCNDCKKNRKEEIEQYIKEEKLRRCMRTLGSWGTIDDVLEKLREYNETNGTHLSYGQYVAMVDEMGKLR